MPNDPERLSKEVAQRKMVSPFQTFYFSDLLAFAIYEKLLDPQIFNAKTLNWLRNYTAHNRHFVAITESGGGQLIYNFKSLKDFVKDINDFLKASEQLDILLYKIRSALVL